MEIFMNKLSSCGKRKLIIEFSYKNHYQLYSYLHSFIHNIKFKRLFFFYYNHIFPYFFLISFIEK